MPHYVLKDFGKVDQDWLADMLAGIADGAVSLAEGDTGRFQNAVALRLNPPRSSNSRDRPKAELKPADPAPKPQDDRSAMQKLIDKFR